MVTEKWPKMGTEISLKNTPREPKIEQKSVPKNGNAELDPWGGEVRKS